MNKIITDVMVAIGGGAILKSLFQKFAPMLIGKYFPELIDLAINFALSNPKSKAILLAARPELEQAASIAEVEIKKDLDAAK